MKSTIPKTKDGEHHSSAQTPGSIINKKATVLHDNRYDTVLQARLSTSNNESTDSLPINAQPYFIDNRPLQKKVNNTGLPDRLKSGTENLSGHSLDDVQVHYNSVKPAQLQALAYAQGNQIHLAPGQEKHLPHEAWHVVQQKQGRVKPTLQMKGRVAINDDKGLEKEADLMGRQALAYNASQIVPQISSASTSTTSNDIYQRVVQITFEAPAHEMEVEDFDPNTAKIIMINATRDSSNIAVENKSLGSSQLAHTTSHAVFTYMFVRELDQKTWAEAWHVLKDKYVFLKALLDKWLADDKMKLKVNALIRNSLPGMIQEGINNCDAKLHRDGHSILNAVWGARIKTGGINDWNITIMNQQQ